MEHGEHHASKDTREGTVGDAEEVLVHHERRHRAGSGEDGGTEEQARPVAPEEPSEASRYFLRVNDVRARRLHTTAQRQALSVACDTCAVAGCDRPFAWCEIHHANAWSRGGDTDLDNGIPLCGFHHNRAHEGRWDLRRHSRGEWRFHRRR
jgi:hypothetical protein